MFGGGWLGNRDRNVGADDADSVGAAMTWISVVADACAAQVQEAAVQAGNSLLAFAPASQQDPEPEHAGVETFEWLPPRERDGMVTLRDRAELRAADAADAVESGLDRLRNWAETVSWLGTRQTDTADEMDQPRQARWGDTSPRWKRLGFQSSNPRTDLRTGILALDNLVYFCEKNPSEAALLCMEAGPDDLDYPLAIASFNLTQLLAWYFGLVPGPNPAGPGVTIPRLDEMMQIHAFARLCLLSDDDSQPGGEHGFDELHSASLIRLHMAWRSMKTADPTKNISAFPELLQETLAVVDHVLRESPLERATELRRIRDLPSLQRRSHRE